ncbi:cupin domain-containing protein [Xylogone sp. PMI_703]|nr:cupin domain-containing protein [Xylogone sp. PMI_703]
MSAQPLLPNGLPAINRYITTHNSEGKAVLSDCVPESSINSWQKIDPGANFFLGYTTHSFPVAASQPSTASPAKDIETYTADLHSPPGLSISNGTVLRFVDIAPGTTSPMHRTVSLDYGVVLEGTIELVLDSGVTRIMNRGDVCVQRGTAHAWRNISTDGKWARMMYVLQPMEKVEIGGKLLSEDLAEMQNVKASA